MDTKETAILLVGFGAPERPEDVPEFLHRVAAGRDIPETRLKQTAEHYYRLGGSPYNASVRAQAESLIDEFGRRGIELPVYVGMRNWNPTLVQTLRKMTSDGIRRAALITLAPHAGPVSSERYEDALAEAQRLAGPQVPVLVPIAAWHGDKGFVQAIVERVSELMARSQGHDPGTLAWIFTVHSIPVEAAKGSPYVAEYRETVGRVAAELGIADPVLAFQSRSGRRNTPWLEPDIREALKEAAAAGKSTAVVVPVGFVNENVELLYDLDTEARQVAGVAGIEMLRVKAVESHPRFISMLADRIAQALNLGPSS